MADRIVFLVPVSLRVGPGQSGGADPGKLARQFSRYGRSITGMPPLVVYRTTDGEFGIFDGVTRATRAARFCGNEVVPAVVVGEIKVTGLGLPTIEELMP